MGAHSSNRRQFLATSLGSGMGILAARPGARRDSSPAKRFNVLYLMPDQLRRQALRAHGDQVIRTPRIDALACESLVFDRAVSTTPVCSAYRTQMLTGLYTHATGNKLAPGDDTLYRRLDGAGYHVGHIGKWHMTPRDMQAESGFVPPVIRPGISYSAMYEVEHRYRKGVWFLNDDETPRSAGPWEPDNQAELAIRYLQERREGGEPFFLMLSLGPPHQPYAPLPRHDTFRVEDIELPPNVPRGMAERARHRIALYYGLMNSVDEVIGRVLDALSENGLDESTLVVFTSDHGDMLFSQGEQYKRRPWEESIGVPFFVRFPKRHPHARRGRANEIFRTADILPTVLDLLGMHPPSGLHGRAFFQDPALEACYLEQTSGANAPYRAPWRGVLTSDGWKMATSRGHERWILYHLAEDPLERRNLVDDSRYRGKYDELEGLLREMARDLGDVYFA